MPVLNFLNQYQKKRLQKALRDSSCPHFRERVLILLLLNDGKTYQEIAEFIGCSHRTVAYWAAHGDPDSLESLSDGRSPGKPRKANREYIELLLKLSETNPREIGFDFDKWTSTRLATYLSQQTGIELSSSQVRRILKKNR